MEIPQTQQAPDTPEAMSPRPIGVLALGLMFVASASFTWAYLSDASTPASPAVLASAAEAADRRHPAPDRFAGISLKAKSAIVVDETAGRVLFALNPDVQWPLASLTKVPLALVVAQSLPPGTIITMPPSVAHFPSGSKWKLSDIIDYTLAISSNDGADVLADAADGAIRRTFPDAPETHATLWRMNQLVQSLGLSRTYFLNDNGLDESPNQAGAYGSARDMATLFAYAAKSAPDTFAATTLQSFNIHSTDGARATAVNTDQALPAISGIVIGKTGYTDLAGGNLAVVFDTKGHRLVAVVLGSSQTGRFDDMKTLIARSTDAIAVEK